MNLDRREFIAMTLITASCLRAQAKGALASHIKIAADAEPGDRLIITGRVFDGSGHPVPNVEIYAYHTDANGYYRTDHRVPDWPSMPPRLEGRLQTASDGSYAIDTIRPAPYPSRGNPAHIHFRLFAPGRSREGAILWFTGDPYLTADQIRLYASGGTFSRIQTLERRSDGRLHCTRDFRLGSEEIP